MTPLAYLLMSAALQSIDPRLEEASSIAGAGTWPTFRRVTLPLILPAAAASALLLFIQTVESFEVPLLLGGRARVAVYTTEVYFNTSRMPTDWGLASTYSMMLLLLAMVLLFVYFRLVRHGERYQTITGKDYRPRRIDLGGWKYPDLRAVSCCWFFSSPACLFSPCSTRRSCRAFKRRPLRRFQAMTSIELRQSACRRRLCLEAAVEQHAARRRYRRPP